MDDLSGFDWSSKSGTNPSKPSPMNPPSFAMRPAQTPFQGSLSGRSTPLSAQGTASSIPQRPSSTKPTTDSFSNLMKFGPTKSNSNLSLSERQAQLEQDKKKKEDERRKAAEQTYGNGQFWDSLGSRGSTASPGLQKPTPPSTQNDDDDDDLFAAFNKDTKVDKSSYYPPPESRKSTPAQTLDLTQPSAWEPHKDLTSGSFDAQDDDPFGLSEMKSSRPPPKVSLQADDDDFMGDLGRPVEEVRRKQEVPQPAAGKPIEYDESSSSDEDIPSMPRRQSAERHQSKRGDPDHDRAVAELIDYGFSPEDARRGLTESGAGNDVQAAANWLLDDAHRKSKAKAQGAGNRSSNNRETSRRDDRSPARQDPDFAKTAAAVGNSLFKTANSLWKTGQKKVQRAVADFQQDGDPNQPKWMREVQQSQSQPRPSRTEALNATDEAKMLDSGGRPLKSTRDIYQSTAEPWQNPQPARNASPAPAASSRASPVPRWQQQPAPPLVANARSRLDRLAVDDDDDLFSAHVSARRRQAASPAPQQTKASVPEPDLLFGGGATSKPVQPPAQQPVQTSAPRPATVPSQRRSPLPKPSRQIPPIDPGSLQTSTKHRLEGTAHFKRGDFAAAHESYASSLRAVPSKHPLAILLLTNRALTALKTGEPKQAISDAESAVELIGPGLGQGETIAAKNENGQDEQKDMKDLYGKALSRKAEALEQMEKWAEAGATWKICVEVGVGGANAIKGRQRCQAALAPKPKPVAKTVTKPKPKQPAISSLAPQKESEAVARMREANAAAAREDDEKFALSDKVDAKISAWRDGKRDNLRALIGSLDNVLWEGSGWKKVGMHELVMANKVKISYMKAIAKTHPDKLAQDASTEVRLIAGLVFSTLNESWDKFKTDNGL